MKWKITYSKEAKKFIDNQGIQFDIKDTVNKLLKKIKGEDISIDLKKLVGDWKGYFGIRIGKIRLIFSISKEDREIYVGKVDFRGDIYK
ncbi:hypothetical protein ES703_95978 [subsurface metagenome]